MRWTVNGSLLAVIPVFLVFVIVKGAFVPTDDRACQIVHYGVRGTVVDAADRPVSGVWVDVEDQSGDMLGQVVTDQVGGFFVGRLSSVACEVITIQVWGHGYKAQETIYYPPHDGKAGELPYRLRVRFE